MWHTASIRIVIVCVLNIFSIRSIEIKFLNFFTFLLMVSMSWTIMMNFVFHIFVCLFRFFTLRYSAFWFTSMRFCTFLYYFYALRCIMMLTCAFVCVTMRPHSDALVCIAQLSSLNHSHISKCCFPIKC